MVGITLAIVGVVATIFPSWFAPLTGASGPPPDLFEAVERRVRGGMILGVGLVFIAVTALRPWSTSIPQAIFYFVAGALAARLVGIVLDGAVPKQWLWVGVEAALMAAVGFWLWRVGNTAS